MTWATAPFAKVLAEPTRNGIYKAKEFHGLGAKIVNMGELFAHPRMRGVPMKRVDLTPSEISRFGLRAGDLIFARRSLVAEGAGKCAILMDVPETTAFESSIIRARLNEVAANPLFYYYFFNSPQGAHALGTIRRQVAVAGITGTDLVELLVPVPSKDIQDNVAEILSTLDDKIELNRRINETLEAMAQAIFRDWFVDFGPVRRKMEGATDPVKIMGGVFAGEVGTGSPSANATTKKPVTQNKDEAARLANLFPATLADNGLPAGWEERRLRELAEQHTANLAPAQSSAEIFAHFSLPAYDAGQMPVLESGEKILSNKTVIPPQAVLLSKLNPEIKRVWLPFHEAGTRQICSTEFLVFTGKKPFGRSFIYCLFSDNDFRLMLAGMVTGTSKSHQRVSPKALAERHCIAPPREVVATFELIAAPILRCTLAKKEESQTLAAIRDLLLPKLLSGELRLPDAEKIAEAAE